MKQQIAILLVGILVSCSQKKEIPQNVVAKVYDYVLTEDELKDNILKTNSVVDSLKVVQNYIQQWSRQKLLYRNALINLDNTDELDKLVKKYKEELYVSHYKNALVNKKLDTLVFEVEIDSFYTKNKANFRLNEELVLFKYIHIDKNNRNRNKIKKLFLSDEIEDKHKILSDYKGYEDYYFNDSTWVSLKNVYSQKTDFPILSVVDLANKDRVIEKKGVDRSVYYIYIKESLSKGNMAPLEYIKPTVKNILLHKNKMKFFDRMEQILIDDAVKQKKYEVY